MHFLVDVYDKNSDLIEGFILATLKRLDFSDKTLVNSTELHNAFVSLELLYECDENLMQISPNIQRLNKEDVSQIGKSRAYLVSDNIKEKPYEITSPYISTASSKLCITVVYKTQTGYLFMDFVVRKLLQRLHLIERDSIFKKIGRYSYALISSSLLFFGLFLVFYGLYSFASFFFGDEIIGMEIIFKPVIALTLGLAVFDLGKTIFEQEVITKTEKTNELFNPKSLTNFIVSIIIALLIEALLIVFKISLHDYKDLPYAAILIGAIAFLLFVFVSFVKSQKELKPIS